MSSGGRATITQPNYTAFNQQFELQRSAIEQGMSAKTEKKQFKLNSALKAQQEVMAELKEAKMLSAENTQAQAARMAALIGTPPPEKSAKAPIVGRERGGSGTKGKSALRIERQMALAAGDGAGLNIT